jgi:hypothetical protein
MHPEQHGVEWALFGSLCFVFVLCGLFAWIAFELTRPVALVNALHTYRPPARAAVLLSASTESREQLEKETAEHENRDQGIELPLALQSAIEPSQNPGPEHKKVRPNPIKKRNVRTPRERRSRELAWRPRPQREPPDGFKEFWLW